MKLRAINLFQGEFELREVPSAPFSEDLWRNSCGFLARIFGVKSDRKQLAIPGGSSQG